jgi:hypothetical protein
MGGLGAGLGLGLLIVALLEYLDTAVRSERDIWAFTKLPTLASIEWSAALAGSKPARPAKPSRLRRLFTRKPPSTPTQTSAPLQPDDHV